MDPTLLRLVVIAFFIAILWNLGAALYYMMNDAGDGKRMAWALTRRIALSVLFIVLLGLGIWSGWIKPHALGG